MTNIERQYEYQPKWWAILFPLGYYGVGAGILGYKASSNDPDNLPVFYWAVCALCIGFAALHGANAVARLMFRQRVALTHAGLMLPKSPWSSKEVVIAYGAITGLFTSSGVHAPRACRVAIDCQATTGSPPRKIKRARFLYVTHTDGERRIAAEELPSHAAFEEMCGLLTTQVRASGQVGYAEPDATADGPTTTAPRESTAFEAGPPLS
jgi:hypothetical protein